MSHAKRKSLKILVKRAYEDATPEDSYRVLVDRLWPRGRSKETLALGHWARDVAPSAALRSAPSAALRKWFGHKPPRWEAFQQRYRHELDAEEQQQRMQCLLADAKGQSITLVYGARDEEHNQAIVLRAVLSHLSEQSKR